MTIENNIEQLSDERQDAPGSYVPPSDSPLFKLLVKSFIGAGESGTGIDDVTDQGRFGVEVSSQHAQTQEPLEIEERSTGGIEKVTKSDDVYKHLGDSHDQKKHGKRSHLIDIDTIGVSVLKDAGYDAYIVGGTVRDFFLGNQPHDIDITTNALPEEMLSLFEDAGYRVIPTGINHGTITVIDPVNGPVEITTYRTEGEYSDGRRPDYVNFSSSIEEDLARRDFTMNAIAYDPTDGRVVDPYGGQNDIEQGVIRTVGNPTERFMEDGLRPLRAARFSSTLGFDIDSETLDAMSDPKVIENFGKVSKERVRDEVLKAMSGDNPVSFVETTMATGLNQHIIPELYECLGVEQPQKYHEHDVAGHLLEALDYANREGASPFVKLVALLHDIGKPETQGAKEDGQITFHGHDKVGANKIASIMERLRFPKNEVDKAYTLVLNHLVQLPVDSSESAIRRFVNKVGEENIPDLIMLRRADIAGHGDKDTSKVDAELENFVDKYEQMKQSGSATTPSLAIGGKELMEVGMKPGPEMGKVISYLKEVVTEDPSKNNKNDLIDAVNQSGLMKGRVYLKEGEDAPAGYNEKVGSQGGRYYETDKWFGPKTDGQVSLSPEQESAIGWYQDPQGFYMNALLRGGEEEMANTMERRGHSMTPEFVEEVNNYIDVMDSAIASSTLAEDVVGYRGMRVPKGNNPYADLKPGDILQDNGYVSTSTMKSGAAQHTGRMHWQKSFDPSKEESVFVSIDIPAGNNALYVPDFGGEMYEGEAELLLPRGTSMKVSSVRKISPSMTVMRMEVIDPNTSLNKAADVRNWPSKQPIPKRGITHLSDQEKQRILSGEWEGPTDIVYQGPKGGMFYFPHKSEGFVPKGSNPEYAVSEVFEYPTASDEVLDPYYNDLLSDDDEDSDKEEVSQLVEYSGETGQFQRIDKAVLQKEVNFSNLIFKFREGFSGIISKKNPISVGKEKVEMSYPTEVSVVSGAMEDPNLRAWNPNSPPEKSAVNLGGSAKQIQGDVGEQIVYLLYKQHMNLPDSSKVGILKLNELGKGEINNFPYDIVANTGENNRDVIDVKCVLAKDPNPIFKVSLKDMGKKEQAEKYGQHLNDEGTISAPWQNIWDATEAVKQRYTDEKNRQRAAGVENPKVPYGTVDTSDVEHPEAKRFWSHVSAWNKLRIERKRRMQIVRKNKAFEYLQTAEEDGGPKGGPYNLDVWTYGVIWNPDKGIADVYRIKGWHPNEIKVKDILDGKVSDAEYFTTLNVHDPLVQ